ncbi:D-alanine--D-alanine ligase [Cohnella endophytica]|uniref:D-alanine--D-alanine ligase n=1 Tax=Cohnella endophytica TaxID=2419778 RepID=A0A494Y5Y5_9BACL|nr:D-alanine--D-alanine ligase family protein [Cohnella endophytica]RKP58032.1 D-alanine--D-alanine ligase [Cohnella endophytica]
MKTILYVLYGGRSPEHEISLRTALTVLQSIDLSEYATYPIHIAQDGTWSSAGKLEIPPNEPEKLILQPRCERIAASLGEVLKELLSLDGPKVVLPLLHGSNGEDGTVQGLMELLDIPYVGNGVLASAVALDKAVCKALLAQDGIPVTEYVVFTLSDWARESTPISQRIASEIGYPAYVKPASLGSSIGISRCEDEGELVLAIENAFRYDRKIVVEREVVGREIQVAVMGNDEPSASLPGEFIQDKAFFDFDAKYVDGRLKMSIPAELPAELTERIRSLAVQAYRAVNASGLARVDFFVERDGALFVNEINSLPGFTKFSMYPVMWERTDGTAYADLIRRLIGYAFERHDSKQTIQYMR